jgi:hypothetical protein
VPLRYLKQQRIDLENIRVQVVKCKVMVWSLLNSIMLL